MLAVAVSGVMTLGALVSLFVGVCFLLVTGLRWTGLLRAALSECRAVPSVQQRAAGLDKWCARCGRRLSSLAWGHARRLQCAHCRLAVCRHCCARATNSPSQRWLCVSCRKLRDVRLQSGEWFYQQLRQRFRSTVAALGNPDKKDGEVQEFMEKLVETIIGGGLDDVILYPLSDRTDYISFCARYQALLVHLLRCLYIDLKMALADSASPDEEAASDLHTELKQLMKQIIHDAMSHPPLKEGNGELSWPPPSLNSMDSLSQRSYEDILATAILNKIFTKYHIGKPRGKCRSNEKILDKNSNLLPGKPTDKMQGDGEASRSESDDSNSIANSVEDNCWSDSNHVDGPLSVTIEECIEEVTTRYSSDDEEEPPSELDRFLSSLKYVKRQRATFPELGKDIVDGGLSSSSSEEEGEVEEAAGLARARRLRERDSDLSASVEQLNPVDTWEENWLFQRRKLKNMGTCQPVPVPMLVPLPTEDCRAMIGDVDADEMSDLTDCSDSVLEDLIDGPDDKHYFESRRESSEEEKPIEVVEKQREKFLKCISEDLKSLMKPQVGARGLSPEVNLSSEGSSPEVNLSPEGSSPDTDMGHSQLDTSSQQNQVTLAADDLSAKEDQSPVSPETESSNSYSIVETRNLNVPVLQVESGEVSLDVQQDSEYTVAYATLAQVRSTASEGPSLSPTPSSTPSPMPKPRTVLSTTTASETTSPEQLLAEEKSDEDSNKIDELSLPPKPGTIAEREHLKWQKAPPLANNPYSKENIVRRQRQRMYLSRHSSSENSIEFPELTGSKEPSLLEIDSKKRREDYNKYNRDYYVNLAERREVEVSSTGGFEREVLRSGVAQVTLRAHGASPNFKLNPLYEETRETIAETLSPQASKRSSKTESGYASSLDSLSSALASGERLAPPTTPEVMERSLLTLTRLRSEVPSSLRLRPRRPRSRLGGSLRLNRSSHLQW